MTAEDTAGRKDHSHDWDVFSNGRFPFYYREEPVKTTRSTTLVLLVVLVLVVAVLALSYGTRSGRQAVRQVSRVARLARNATQIYPSPVLMLKISGGPREAGFQLEVFESGRLVVSGRDNVEETLSAATAHRLFELGIAALGDFSSRGCEPWRKGNVNATLYVLIDGGWWGSSCRNSLDWPKQAGAETHRLLNEIRRYLPNGQKFPAEF